MTDKRYEDDDYTLVMYNRYLMLREQLQDASCGKDSALGAAAILVCAVLEEVTFSQDNEVSSLVRIADALDVFARIAKRFAP